MRETVYEKVESAEADFFILNQGVMSVPEGTILATRPLATFIGGEMVYEAQYAHF
jgi:predicted amidohydrolase YtcJ